MKSTHIDREEKSTLTNTHNGFYNFNNKLRELDLSLNSIKVETLQINITKLCNQACQHCHVDSSPYRKEQMSFETVSECLRALKDYPEIVNLDITGGAPELNPQFKHIVSEAKKLGKHVMVRHNLTVTLDGNPQTGENMEYLPEFFADHKVEVISSLPYYQEFFTDKQRGKGVFEKSINAIMRLNDVGYGKPETGLNLNFVYNPVGAYLPPEQCVLEKDYKRELKNRFDIEFNNLYTITNMPIYRFKKMLERIDGYEDYMEKLVNAFNPAAAEGIMCKTTISVSHDGKIYDCDFNQMLDLQLRNGKLLTKKILTITG